MPRFAEAPALAGIDAGAVRRRLWSRMSANLWVALALWLGSNLFTYGIANFATWEGAAHYGRMKDLCLWDCRWYQSIVEFGYFHSITEARATHPEHQDWVAVNWPFYPLFPMTASGLRKVFRLSPAGSLVLAGKLELLLAIYAFLLMLSGELETTEDRVRAGSLVAFNPYLIYAHAGYSEPLYFTLIALSFYFARRSRWLAAGAMGGLASATRVTGFLFSISYLLEWLRAQEGRLSWRALDRKAVIGLLLCPLGMALFVLHLRARVGDALAFQQAEISWGRWLGNPISTLILCFQQTRLHWPPVWAVMVIAACLVSLWLFKLGKPEMGTYLALVLLLATSTGYWSVARYIWWQPPFLYAIYRLLRRNAGAWLIYSALAAGMAAFMVLEWFSGHNFVV